MAGPAKNGPPRKGLETVQYSRVRKDVIAMLDSGMRNADIARELGYHPSSTLRIIQRVNAEIATEATDNYLHYKARELRHLEKLRAALEPKLFGPDIIPREQDITAAVQLSARISKLLGLDSPQRIEVNHDPEGTDQATNLMAFADRLERLSLLQDRMAISSGSSTELGSGRSEDEQIEALTRPSQPVIDVYATETTPNDEYEPIDEDVMNIEPNDADDDDVMEVMRVGNPPPLDPETPGRWIGGKFVPWWEDGTGEIDVDDQGIDDPWYEDPATYDEPGYNMDIDGD